MHLVYIPFLFHSKEYCNTSSLYLDHPLIYNNFDKFIVQDPTAENLMSSDTQIQPTANSIVHHSIVHQSLVKL